MLSSGAFAVLMLPPNNARMDKFGYQRPFDHHVTKEQGVCAAVEHPMELEAMEDGLLDEDVSSESDDEEESSDPGGIGAASDLPPPSRTKLAAMRSGLDTKEAANGQADVAAADRVAVERRRRQPEDSRCSAEALRTHGTFQAQQRGCEGVSGPSGGDRAAQSSRENPAGGTAERGARWDGEVPVKRGRGRPRKHPRPQAPGEHAAGGGSERAALQSGVVSVKRGRGRPRKHRPLQAPERAAHGAAAVCGTGKFPGGRGRGKPVREPPVATAVSERVVRPDRGRGRPRKESLEEEVEDSVVGGVSEGGRRRLRRWGSWEVAVVRAEAMAEAEEMQGMQDAEAEVQMPDSTAERFVGGGERVRLCVGARM